MIIVDAHQDIAFNATATGRDYLRPVAATRELEGSRTEDIATLGLADALAAGVGIVFGTLFVAPAGSMRNGEPEYHTAEEAHAQAEQQLAVYQNMARHPQVTLIENRAHLSGVLDAWEQGTPHLGIVVLMEGADPIRTPAEAADWAAAGVRLVGPAWGPTRYSGGTGAPGPLTPEGRQLMRELDRSRLALDISHIAEASFWDALELFDGPVIASHSNCRALVPGEREDRHLSDAMIKALIERDGVIGMVLYNRFLDSSWTCARGKAGVGLDTVLRHIDHVCQLAGNARHVAIGSDFDGGFGSEAIPHELDSIADLPRLAEALARVGFSDDDVAAVMGRNWLRKLEQILP
jgi:membrane dipeptidase